MSFVNINRRTKPDPNQEVVRGLVERHITTQKSVSELKQLHEKLEQRVSEIKIPEMPEMPTIPPFPEIPTHVELYTRVAQLEQDLLLARETSGDLNNTLEHTIKALKKTTREQMDGQFHVTSLGERVQGAENHILALAAELSSYKNRTFWQKLKDLFV